MIENEFVGKSILTQRLACSLTDFIQHNTASTVIIQLDQRSTNQRFTTIGKVLVKLRFKVHGYYEHPIVGFVYLFICFFEKKRNFKYHTFGILMWTLFSLINKIILITVTIIIKSIYAYYQESINKPESFCWLTNSSLP